MVSSPNPAGVYAVAIVLIIAATIAVALRYAARRIRAAPWKSDDWLIFVAMLFTWGLGIILIYGTSQGTLGTHTALNPKTGAVIPTHHENDLSMYNGMSALLTVLAVGALKLGVVMFYRRIFINDRFRIISLIVAILISLWTVAFFFATVLECKGHNMDLLWKSIVTFKKECGMYKDAVFGHSISDVITDLVVLSLPLPEIWKLHTTVRQKVLISMIFLIGLLSTAAGTARLVIVSKNVVETTPGARDVRGVGTNTMVWTYVEVGVGVVAACLPTLKPIIDSRGLESIVASVRSIVSLGSNNSNNSRSRNTGNAQDRSGDLEMYPFNAGKNHNYSEISAAESVANHPGFPPQAVIREDAVTVKSERAAGATSAAGSSSKD